MGIFGVQTFGDALEPEVVRRMGEIRARYVRLPVQWRFIEPLNTVPPSFTWGGTDKAIGTLAEAGTSVIPVLYTRPGWAATTDCGPIDRVPLSRYHAYLTALVERYDGDGVADAPGSPRVGHWEVENEQDFDPAHGGGSAGHGSCFGGTGAGDYGAQLRAAYLAIKAADPRATVLFGGVAYDRFYNRASYSPPGPFDFNFTRDVLIWLIENHGEEAEWPFFDWMALHVYNDYRNNWDGPQPYRQELRAKLSHFRQFQLVRGGSYDLRDVPIALTEGSLASLPGDDFTLRSEDLQAAYPGQFLARAMAERVPAVLWFVMEDAFSGPCASRYDWITVGLLRSLDVFTRAQACGPNNPIPSYHVTLDHEPKPAFHAYRTAQELLAGAIFDTELGVAQTGSHQIEAYRVFMPGQGYRIVAFADNGERIGRVGSLPANVPMTFNAGVLPGWTGRIAVIDHLGAATLYEGSSVTIEIGQAPVYVRPD